ncbi:hypothetical protein BT69DRAFT_1348845 [Atractiella rhizophila]|nr:hypothetical protein BT69DRAFT_1348845 [Atractiella rhizophila]
METSPTVQKGTTRRIVTYGSKASKAPLLSPAPAAANAKEAKDSTPIVGRASLSPSANTSPTPTPSSRVADGSDSDGSDGEGVESLKAQLGLGDWKKQLAMMDADEGYVPDGLSLPQRDGGGEDEMETGMELHSSPPETPVKSPPSSQRSTRTMTGTELLDIHLSQSQSPLPANVKKNIKKRRVVLSDEEDEEESAKEKKKRRTPPPDRSDGEDSEEEREDEEDDVPDVAVAMKREEARRQKEKKNGAAVIQEEMEESEEQEGEGSRKKRKSKGKEPKLKKISKKELEASRAEIQRYNREQDVVVPTTRNRLDPKDLWDKLQKSTKVPSNAQATWRPIIERQPQPRAKKEKRDLTLLEKTSSINDPDDIDVELHRERRSKRSKSVKDGSEIEETPAKPLVDMNMGMTLEVDEEFEMQVDGNAEGEGTEEEGEGEEAEGGMDALFARIQQKHFAPGPQMSGDGDSSSDDGLELVGEPADPKTKTKARRPLLHHQSQSLPTKSQFAQRARTFNPESSSPIMVQTTTKKARSTLLNLHGPALAKSRKKLDFGQTKPYPNSNSNLNARRPEVTHESLNSRLLLEASRKNLELREKKREEWMKRGPSRIERLREAQRELERDEGVQKKETLMEVLERKRREKDLSGGEDEEEEEDADWTPDMEGREEEEEPVVDFDEDENIVEKMDEEVEEEDEEEEEEVPAVTEEQEEQKEEEGPASPTKEIGHDLAPKLDDKPPATMDPNEFIVFDGPMDLGGGGFSQFFNDGVSQANGKAALEVAPTQGPLLAPAATFDFLPSIPISQAGKERDAQIIEEALGGFGVKVPEQPKETFINSQGFFTQTRPADMDIDDLLTTNSHPLFPYEPSQFTQSQRDSPTQLRILPSLAEQDEEMEPDIESEAQKNAAPNAFDLLQAGARMAAKVKEREERNKARKERAADAADFINDAAVESDEENERWGLKFGGKGDDEEEDPNDDGKDVAEMMDDTAVDAETKAQQDALAEERYRQDLEMDEAKRQKKAEEIVQGKVRRKRKTNDLDLDSDFSEDDDDFGKSKKFREKKRKLAGNNKWESLREKPDMAAWCKTYDGMAVVEDGNYGFLVEAEVEGRGDSESDEGESQKPKAKPSRRQQERLREFERDEAELEDAIQEAAMRDAHLLKLDHSSSPVKYETNDYYGVSAPQKLAGHVGTSSGSIDAWNYTLTAHLKPSERQLRFAEQAKKLNNEESQSDGRVAGKNSAVTSFKTSKPRPATKSFIATAPGKGKQPSKAVSGKSDDLKGRLTRLGKEKSFR